jgi:hypothetical protein
VVPVVLMALVPRVTFLTLLILILSLLKHNSLFPEEVPVSVLTLSEISCMLPVPPLSLNSLMSLLAMSFFPEESVSLHHGEK